MRRICAWCGRGLDDLETNSPTEPVSHGICAACMSFVLDSNPKHVRDFIDRLAAPVLLVDQNVAVVDANVAASVAFRRSPEDLEGMLGGEIVECAYARLPGGCGRTVHCAACQIRGAVTHTHQTGEPVHGVEAYNDVRTRTGVVRRRIRLSTERVDGTVLLRLDPVEDFPIARPAASP